MAAKTSGVMGLLQLLSTPLMALATYAGVPEAWAGSHASVDAWAALLCLALLIITATIYVVTRPRPVYLLDFACLKLGDAHSCTCETMMRQMRLAGPFSEDSLAFQQRMLERSGLGDSTYVPYCFLRTPIDPCMAEAREEATEAMFGAVDVLFAQTGVRAGEIGVVVVNCSLFNPAPSLSAMIVNRYAMGEGVRTYSLGGMGCSAGLIAIDLARQLLQGGDQTETQDRPATVTFLLDLTPAAGSS